MQWDDRTDTTCVWWLAEKGGLEVLGVVWGGCSVGREG